MCTSPLDPSIDSSAYVTFARLSALIINFLADLCLSEVIYMGSAYVSKELPTFALREKNMGTTLPRISPNPTVRGRYVYFANILQDSNNHLEVSNMQGRQSQPEVPEMAVACLQYFATSIAESRLHGYTHLSIEWAIVGWGSVPR